MSESGVANSQSSEDSVEFSILQTMPVWNYVFYSVKFISFLKVRLTLPFWMKLSFYILFYIV